MITHLSRLHSLGGVQRALTSFLCEVPKLADGEQSLITGSRLHPITLESLSSTPVPISYFARWGGVTLPKHPKRFRQWRMASLLKKVRPDVLLMWDYSKDVHAVREAQKLGACVIYYDHGGSFGLKGAEQRKRVFDAVDGFICVSTAVKKALEQKWNVKAPLVVCPNALRREVSPPSPQGKTYSPARTFKIGVAGRMDIAKGFSLAIRMLPYLIKDNIPVELHLAGDGGHRKFFEELAVELGVEDRCVFHGLISDMRAFYQEVDVCLVPSLNESFGLVSIEAQSWGCVTLVAGVDGLPDTVDDGLSGRVVPATLPLDRFPEFKRLSEDPKRFIYDASQDALNSPLMVDPQALADAVIGYVEKPEVFNAASRHASRFALERFDSTRQVAQLLSAVDTLQSLRRGV